MFENNGSSKIAQLADKCSGLVHHILRRKKVATGSRGEKKMRMRTVLIAGGSGLLGSRLSQLLQEKGYGVIHLGRNPRSGGSIRTYRWDPLRGELDREAVEQADYVVNLAGAGIADRPWTAARKQLIIDSRVESTRLLKRSMSERSEPPLAYVAASAIGYYGDRGEEMMREEDPPAEGFLSASTCAWEEAIREVRETGIRTVGLRIGIVLSTKGGALEKILLPFRFRQGAYFGDGRQWMSWIHIDDMCRMIIAAMENESMQGFYNGVAPHPVRNRELVRQVRKALGKAALLIPVPSWALRLAMGELADVILGSTRVSAEKIRRTGFTFEFPELLPALQDLVVRKV
ncbi:MAG: hypothetical protein RLY31_2222 [Bacteroidota bacterium]